MTALVLEVLLDLVLLTVAGWLIISYAVLPLVRWARRRSPHIPDKRRLS